MRERKRNGGVFGSQDLAERAIWRATLPQREKWLIIGALLGLTVAAWAFTAYQTRLRMS